MNRSAEPSPSEPPEEPDGGTVIACVILALSFVLGAPGNLLVIWTILRHIRQFSHTLLLILHLAAADLLILITLPLWIYSLVHTWAFGEALCKALVYIVSVCMFSSIFIITLMSVERFVAVCHPFVMLRWKSKRAMNGCLVVLWIVALFLGVPVFLTQTLDELNGAEQCFSREFPSGTHTAIFLCLETLGGFVIPFIVLSVCYCQVGAQLKRMSFKSKPKSMAIILSVVTAFTLCWLPYHITNVIHLVCLLGSSAEQECVPEILVLSSGALAFISSSVNPVLYAVFARNLRGSFRESPLVRLFQELAAHTNRLKELALQQQTGQRAASTHVQLVSYSVCEKNNENSGNCDVEN